MKNGSKKNFVYHMVYQFFLMVLPLITMPYVSRVLGAEGIGTYSYTYSIANYFALFAALGGENYGNRYIAKVRDNPEERNRAFSEVYSLQIVISACVIVAYLLYAFLFAEYRTIALLQSFYVLSVLFDVNWLFFGMENFKLTVSKKIIIKIANVVLVFAFVKENTDLWKYVLVLSLGYFLSQSSMLLFSHRYVRFTFVGIKKAKSHFKDFIILFIPIVATSIYRMMDKVMLGSMSAISQVGYYESAEKLINVCLCVISSFGAVMMPRMSNMIGKGNITESKQLFVRSMEIAIFIGCAIAFGIAAVAADFIPVFYGDGYENSIIITILLSITVPFITWACIVRTMYLIPAERNKIYINSVLLGAIVNVIINALIIPRYAAIGAAIGTIVAEITVAVYQSVLIRKELNLQKCLKKAVPFIIFGIIMWLFVTYIPVAFGNGIMHLLVKICIGAICYLVLSFLYFVLTKNELLYSLFVRVKSNDT